MSTETTETKQLSAEQTTQRLRYIAEGIETVQRAAGQAAMTFLAMVVNGHQRPPARLEGDLNLIEDEIEALKYHIAALR